MRKKWTRTGGPRGRYKGLERNKNCLLNNPEAKCGICGSKSYLETHHLDCIGPHNNDHVDNSINNLTVLCSSCHKQLHFYFKNHKRNNDIISLRKDGQTLQSIGDIYGISRQRVYEILQKAKGK